VQEGRQPQHVMRDPKLNHFSHLVVLSELVPASTDLKQFVRDLAANSQ
jgi:hypothetical protein